MKINFLISSLSGGGAEKVLTVLAKEFSKNGHNVGILSLEKRPQFYQVYKDIELVKVKNKKQGKIIGFLEDIKAIHKFIKQRDADISISFLTRCNLLALINAIFVGNKVIVCDRNNPLREHSKLVFWLSCQLYRKAIGIAVQTEKIKSFYPDFLQKKIYVLENPIDMEALNKQLIDEKISKDRAIISMGRLEPQKDFITLINAFSYIARDYKDWKLNIFGIGEMKEQIEKKIFELNLQEQVFLCGRTETPFLEMKKSSIFVLSSNYEGFPNVLCEAMYAGLPCISSDCISGPGELIENEKNGYLFPVGDEDLLAEQLKELLSNEDLRESFGQEAHKTVSRLSVEEIYEKWATMVSEVIG